MHIRRTLVALIAASAALGAGTANAEGEENISIGANNGSFGAIFTHTTTGPLTDGESHHIDHNCTFTINGVGNTVTLTVVAEATAGPHLVAVSTGIRCEVYDRDGTMVASVASALPGTAVVDATTTGLIPNNAPYTVCTVGTGQWRDSHQYTTSQRCQYPNLPI